MLYDYRKKVKQFSRKIIIIIIMHMNSKAYSMHGTQFTITRLLLKINFSNHIETVWIKTCWMSIQHLTNISHSNMSLGRTRSSVQRCNKNSKMHQSMSSKRSNSNNN